MSLKYLKEKYYGLPVWYCYVFVFVLGCVIGGMLE